MKPKLSIFIPVYNSVSFVSKLFDSILEQDFSSIELIIIDDGSVDDFDGFFNLKYKSLFLDKILSVQHLKQDNQGQAFSLNKALKLINGTFFMWIDSDDWFEGDSIRERIRFLEDNVDYGMVRTDGFVVDEATGIKKLYSQDVKLVNEDIFDDLIFENNVYFCPIGYMVRTKSLFDVIPNKNIFISRGGQNWQILLPIANKFKCGYIDKPLFNYLVRKGSHSRVVENNVDELMLKYDEHHLIIKETLKSIGNYSCYEKKLKRKYDNIKISILFRCRSSKKISNYRIKIFNLTIKSIVKLFLLKNIF